MKGILKKQFTFLLYGFVFWLPVILVVYVGALLFGNGEKVGKTILGVVVPEKFLYAGLGFVLCILIIYLSGIILKLTKVGKILSKIPVIGIFFGQGEIMTVGRLSHMQACMFLYSPTCIAFGWILAEEKVQLSGENASFPLLCVYFPSIPALVTGSVFVMRKDAVMKLGNSSTEVIDLLLYAFRSPTALKYLPWEDETPEEFKERSKIFGLK
jgi:uncharacterized membrane protein